MKKVNIFFSVKVPSDMDQNEIENECEGDNNEKIEQNEDQEEEYNSNKDEEMSDTSESLSYATSQTESQHDNNYSQVDNNIKTILIYQSNFQDYVENFGCVDCKNDLKDMLKVITNN